MLLTLRHNVCKHPRMTTSSMKLLALAPLLLAACSPVSEQASLDVTDFDDGFEDDDKLAIALEDSPSGGPFFDFCPAPAATRSVNLRNASWMAYLAANEYAHLGYLAPNLLELGFGNGGDLFWRGCGVSLREVRAWEEANAEAVETAFGEGPAAMQKLVEWQLDPDNPEKWSLCARDWAEVTAYDGTEYPAAAMERWLIQEPSDDSYLAFFSGGEITDFGEAFEKGSTQAFFARHTKLPVAVFSFRGTEPDRLEDIAADIRAWDITLSRQGDHWSEGWGEVHGGFYGAFDSLLVQFDQQLSQLEGSEDGIWVTGHSLGGALGTLMTAYILEQKERGKDYDLRGFYSFGSPRVGDEDFMRRFDSLTAKYDVHVGRVRNDNDVVTHVPTGIFNDWSHVGTRVYMTPENLSFPTEQPGYSGLLGLGSVGDHSMVAQDDSGGPAGYYDRLLDFTRDEAYVDWSLCDVTPGPSTEAEGE